MSNNNTTFVTSIFDIYDTPYENKTIEWRFDRFREIAETGIPICIYVDEELISKVKEFVTPFENIKIAKVMRLEDTFVGGVCTAAKVAGEDYSLPTHRNHVKDTEEYMILMNSKFEFMNDAAQQNLWNTVYFAWIDFSMTFIFKDIAETIENLRILANRPFRDTSFITVPGCWEKRFILNENNSISMTRLLESVVWRFCGGFSLGDSWSVAEMFWLYQIHFASFLRTHRKLVWEVNFWAWLEQTTEWSPIWYAADHNDSIINIPVQMYSVPLKPVEKKINYDYPKIENYEPMQCSHIEYAGRHYINTRYVNYWYKEDGIMYILNEKGHIITQNMLSELDTVSWRPKGYTRMREDETLGLPIKENVAFHGLEDIRLYEYDGKIKFIATSINNASPSSFASMIVGEYDVDTAGYRNCTVIGSPYDCWCEKNWIPVVSGGEELFIYKWWPIEIGKIDHVTKRLEIVKRYEIAAPNFRKVRGSTVFVEDGEGGLVGLVHFSEEGSPRQYFHMLVSLDAITLKPMKYSDVFHFQHLGIEFCTGIRMYKETLGGDRCGGGKYMFWISKWDREPVMVTVDRRKIPLLYEF